MAILTISAIPLGRELVEGIPMLVALESNMPATMFFTLDGSEPNSDSEIYLEPIEMPRKSPVHLRVLGISGQDRGYFNIHFSTDTTDFNITRRVDGYGIGVVTDAYNLANSSYDGYGVSEDGYVNVPVTFYDGYLSDFEYKYRNVGGIGFGPGIIVRIGRSGVFLAGNNTSIHWQPSSPNNKNMFFNPRSLYITMDGRDGYDDQIVYSINRPNTGFHDSVKYLGGKEYFEHQPYVSGGLCRTMYNHDTGTAVFYYFDHNETRWIKSIQKFTPSDSPTVGPIKRIGAPFIFKWIFNKRSSL